MAPAILVQLVAEVATSAQRLDQMARSAVRDHPVAVAPYEQDRGLDSIVASYLQRPRLESRELEAMLDQRLPHPAAAASGVP
jgi:hypothetical protein